MPTIRGLDLQADDYMTKPFWVSILIRKIVAVLRQSGQTQDEGYKNMEYQTLSLDLDNYTAAVDGTAYELTQREFGC